MKLNSSIQLKAQKFTDFTIMFGLFPQNQPCFGRD